MWNRLRRDLAVGVASSIVGAVIVALVGRVGGLVQNWAMPIFIAVITLFLLGFYFFGLIFGRGAKQKPVQLPISSMQNMVLVHCAGEGPVAYMNKTPRFEAVRLHFCNRIGQKLKIKHITFNVVISSEHMQEVQRLVDQNVAAHDCSDLTFGFEINADTAAKLQALDPCLVSFQGRASVVVGDEDFSVFFAAGATARIFIDARAIES